MSDCYYLHLEAPNYFFDKYIISPKKVPKDEIDTICHDCKKKFIKFNHDNSIDKWFNQINKTYENNWKIINEQYTNLNKKYNLGLKDFKKVCPSSIKDNLKNLLNILEEGDMICTSLYRGTESYYVYLRDNKLLSKDTIGEYGYELPKIAKRKYNDDYIIPYEVKDYLNLTKSGKIFDTSPSTIILSLGYRYFLLDSNNIPQNELDNWNFYG